MAAVNSKFNSVMVIDDNQIDLYIAAKLIRTRNFAHQVTTFNSAGDALAYITDNQHNLSELPEIILVDIYMPLMSGFDFLEAFDKFSPALKSTIRVFVVSSTIDQTDIQRIKANVNVEAFGTKTISATFLDSIQP